MKRFILAFSCLLIMAGVAWSTGPGLHGDGAQNIVSNGDQSLFKDGTDRAPGIAFLSEVETGIFWPTSRALDLVIGNAAAKSAHVSMNGASTTWGLTLASHMHLGWGSGTTPSVAGDLFLLRDASNTLALRNGTNSQEFRVYNTFTDASNYERLSLRFSSNIINIFGEQAGTGSARTMIIGTEGAGTLIFRTNGSDRWSINSSSGHLTSSLDNTYDIGASGANRPRSIYAGTSFLAPDGTAAAPGIAFTSEADTGLAIIGTQLSLIDAGNARFEVTGLMTARSDGGFSWSSTTLPGDTDDLFLLRDAANVLAQRNGPFAQSFRLYSTFTDSSDYERANIEFVGNNLVIGTQAAGAGAQRELRLQTADTDRLIIGTGGNVSIEGGSFIYTTTQTVASATTTTLTAGNLFNITGVTTITTLNTCDAANTGRLVVLVFDGALTVTDDNAALNLAGDFVTTANDILQLICIGTQWHEISRSVN